MYVKHEFRIFNKELDGQYVDYFLLMDDVRSEEPYGVFLIVGDPADTAGTCAWARNLCKTQEEAKQFIRALAAGGATAVSLGSLVENYIEQNISQIERK